MKHLTQRRFVRPLIALALVFTLGLVATAAAPKASAHSVTCGSFTTSVNKAKLVAKGVTIGYGETLTDGCGSYELHGHLSAIPAGSSSQSYLLLASENDNYIGSAFFTTALQDLYLSEPLHNYSPTTPAFFDVVDFDTNVTYEAGF